MRWDSLRLPDGDADDSDHSQGALFDRAAITRTFDTPGFRGMTFHEVHARSLISKVPEASRMPFRWTINPYRGCSHACAYCLSGDTPVLMADGRTKAIAQVRVGDAVYGTVSRDSFRRYVPTLVLAHWQTVKPAYGITIEDGTSLIASADHRFLTRRGWNYVAGTEQGGRRPHLTMNSELAGVGGFAEPPKESADYRRGYLCAMIRGDRPALIASEALERTCKYLGQDRACALQGLIEWPVAPSLDWAKGFLAGIFDAAGSCSRGALRICNTDPAIIGRIRSCVQSLGLDVDVEPTTPANGYTMLCLRGGLTEQLKFFHGTDPATTGKGAIDGMAVRPDARLRVVSIAALGFDLPMFDMTTGTGDFIANGIVSHNCFARNTHTYLDLDSGHDFDTQIVVKVNAPELLRRELRASRWAGEHIAMGTNVDCYQRAEGKYRLMPGIITALTDVANPFSILTKGTLILRDADLLERAAAVTAVGLNVSVGIIDKSLSRSIESGTPSPERRLGVCAELSERGLRCGVLMGPVLPFLSDSPAQLDEAVARIAAAGATHVSPIVLHLRPGAREWFQRWLTLNHPELVDAYRGLYGNRAYAPASYQRGIADQVAELARKYGVGRASPAAARRVPTASQASAAGPAQETASGVQLSLLGP